MSHRSPHRSNDRIQDSLDLVFIFMLTTLLTVVLLLWMGFDFAHLDDGFMSRVPGDHQFNSWTIHQAIDNLLHRPTDLGYSTQFYNDSQTADTFSYTIAPYAIAVTMLPFHVLTGHNIVLTYNVYLIVTFGLAVVMMTVLIKYLLGTSTYLSAIGGLVVAFSTFRSFQLEHPETISFHVVLLTLYAVHRLIDAPRWRWAMLVAAGYWLTFHTSGYLGMATAIGIVYLLTYLFIKRRERLSALMPYLIVAGLLWLLASLPILQFRLSNVPDHPVTEIVRQSPNIEDLLSSNSVMYRNLMTRPHFRDTMFPGFIVLGLVMFTWRRRQQAATGTALSRRILSHKDIVTLYAGLMLLAYFLALGPTIKINQQAIISSPYAILMQLPGWGALREPNRFVVLAIIASGVLVVYAFDLLLRHRDKAVSVTLVGGLMLLLFVEHIPANNLVPGNHHLQQSLAIPRTDRMYAPMLQNRDRDVYLWLRDQPHPTAVAHHPDRPFLIHQYVIDQAIHGQPMFNGWGTFFPDWYIRARWEMMPNFDALQLFWAQDIQYLLVHRDLMTDDEQTRFDRQWSVYQDRFGGFRRIAQFEGVDVYSLRADPIVHYEFEFDETILSTQRGWHRPETLADGVTVTWSGPGTSSYLYLPPMQAGADYTLTVDIKRAPVVLDALQVFVNDVALITTITRRDETFVVTSHIAGDDIPEASHMTIVRFDVPHTVTGTLPNFKRGIPVGLQFDRIQIERRTA